VGCRRLPWRTPRDRERRPVPVSPRSLLQKPPVENERLKERLCGHAHTGLFERQRVGITRREYSSIDKRASETLRSNTMSVVSLAYVSPNKRMLATSSIGGFVRPPACQHPRAFQGGRRLPRHMQFSSHAFHRASLFVLSVSHLE
jgi:hypothetical protein